MPYDNVCRKILKLVNFEQKLLKKPRVWTNFTFKDMKPQYDTSIFF